MTINKVSSSSPSCSGSSSHQKDMSSRLEETGDHRQFIEVRGSLGRGLGAFTKSKIPCGTRVLAESPILKVNYENADANEILTAFGNLTSDQQASYLELYGYACDDLKGVTAEQMGKPWENITELQRKVLAIHSTNAFNNGVVLLGSRINHSCIPNLHFAYNKTLDKETFHAIRDIQGDEELFIMYNNATHCTRSQRQKDLKQNWGFLCACPACKNTSQGNVMEGKRAELRILNQELARNISLFDGQKAWEDSLKIVQKMAAIQKSEGLLGRDIGLSYHDAAGYCVKLNKKRLAVLFAEKTLEVDRYCVGKDHPDYERRRGNLSRMKESVDSLEAFDEKVIECFPRAFP